MTKRNVGHIFMTFVHVYDRENVRDVAAFGMFVCSYLFLAMPYDLLGFLPRTSGSHHSISTQILRVFPSLFAYVDFMLG